MKRIVIGATAPAFSGSIWHRTTPFRAPAPRWTLTSLRVYQRGYSSCSLRGISAPRDHDLGQKHTHFHSTPESATSLSTRLRRFWATDQAVEVSHLESRQSSVEPVGLIFALIVGLAVIAEIFDFSKVSLQ